MPVVCPRQNGSFSTHVLSVLTIKGVKHLLGSSRSALAPHVLRWLLAQVDHICDDMPEPQASVPHMSARAKAALERGPVHTAAEDGAGPTSSSLKSRAKANWVIHSLHEIFREERETKQQDLQQQQHQHRQERQQQDYMSQQQLMQSQWAYSVTFPPPPPAFPPSIYPPMMAPPPHVYPPPGGSFQPLPPNSYNPYMCLLSMAYPPPPQQQQPYAFPPQAYGPSPPLAQPMY